MSDQDEFMKPRKIDRSLLDEDGSVSSETIENLSEHEIELLANDNIEALREYFEELGDFYAVSDPDFDATTPEGANTVAQRLMNWKDEIDRIQHRAKIEINRRLRAIAWLKQKHEQHLMFYAQSEIQTRGGKLKSVSLPCGAVLRFRKSAAKIEITDEELLIQWIEAQAGSPELLTAVKKSLLKTPINDWWKETGEIPPVGCEIVLAKQTFLISK